MESNDTAITEDDKNIITCLPNTFVISAHCLRTASLYTI